MKIPDNKKAEIIEGMLELLNPDAWETVEEVLNDVSGHELMKEHGIYSTQEGKPVRADLLYNVCITKTKKCNHAQRIGQIIADSQTIEEWETRLAEYLVKHAKDMSAVSKSIPAHLSIKNIKQNEN